MNENDVVTTLQNVKEIKDLGVVFMDNLKPSTQCVKSAAKAVSSGSHQKDVQEY